MQETFGQKSENKHPCSEAVMEKVCLRADEKKINFKIGAVKSLAQILENWRWIIKKSYYETSVEFL